MHTSSPTGVQLSKSHGHVPPSLIPGVIARAVDEATADATASREDVGPLGPMDDVLGRQAADAPPWFEQEVLPLAEACDLRALDDWSVVGFTMARETPWLAAAA